MDECILCGETGKNLAKCKNVNSWNNLVKAATIRNHERIKNVVTTEMGMPCDTVSYHRECRQNFTHKTELSKFTVSDEACTSNNASEKRKSLRGSTSKENVNILPNTCMFCNKDKYIPKTNTREKLLNCAEFRADENIKQSALKHIKDLSCMSETAETILSICSKDLISSEARYHKSCYKGFVRVIQTPKNVENDVDDSSSSVNLELVTSSLEYLGDILNTNMKVIELSEFKKMLKSELDKVGCVLPDSFYKNLRRTLTNKFPNFEFIEVSKNKTLVYDNNMKMEDVLRHHYELQEQLRSLLQESDTILTLIKSALSLHKAIKDNTHVMPFPPSEHDLKYENLANYIPSNLSLFLSTLLSGKSNGQLSEKLEIHRSSFAQDLIYSVTNGFVKTPKSVLFPTVMKSLCNSKEAVNIINKYGHGISYQLINEIETDFALQAMKQQPDKKVLLPDDVFNYDNNVVLMVADNIDNLEHTLTGQDTSHRVNSILIQSKIEPSYPIETNAEVPRKRQCLRSIPEHFRMKSLPEYIKGKRVGPGELTYFHYHKPEKYNNYCEQTLKQHLIWIRTRIIKTHPLLLTPGWTGFNISIRNNTVLVESKISYLDTIDSPATDLKTAYEVLCRSAEIRSRLSLSAVICVFDQAFYAKAMEVYWKNKDTFQNVFLMLGGFHLLMMLLGIVGVRYGDAGFREIVTQSNLINEGSVDRALSGKNYNRAIYMHKIFYEALMRLLLERFVSTSQDGRSLLESLDPHFEQLKLCLCFEKMDSILTSSEFCLFFKQFEAFINYVKTNGTELERFWLSYLEIIELVLNLIYSTRIGDWEFYLSCIKQVIPWTFAYDRLNYAKYLIPFYNDMCTVKETLPDVYLSLTKNEGDKTIENTINRDCKTKGGYIGFSTKFQTTQRWVINSSRRGIYKRLLHDHLSYKSKGYTHRELAESRIKKDCEAVEKVVDTIDNVFRNPWKGGELISLSTGIKATVEVSTDILDAKKRGEEASYNFVMDRSKTSLTQ